ncbi:hypothetical protein GW17_00017232 [Ensete ventricosum]|nr:hypothetical protein GW17_00017232 [Ensete ventricosum]RZS13666.1 hypothetical protein BHM03_00045278 [Ensete ventricosum]
MLSVSVSSPALMFVHILPVAVVCSAQSFHSTGATQRISQVAQRRLHEDGPSSTSAMAGRAPEDGYRIVEDEVDGAVDELPLRVHIEPLNLQRQNTERSDPDRRATTWFFSGPAVAGDGCNHTAEEIKNEAVKNECMHGGTS